MSSATLPPQSPPPLVAQPTEQETFIDHRLRQTRRQVKTVDIVVGLTTLAIGAIVYLLIVALADHWLVSGGLPAWTRWLLWLGLVGAAGAFVFFQLLTPVIRRVNPVYAALTIESSQPTLRNSLINFLLLRSHKREMAAPIYKTIEQRAAADLTKVRAETAVDRAYLIRLFQILAALLAVFCLYLVISPKNPLNSAGRVLFPWSNIEAMTRVSIDDVRPGDTRAFHGEFLTVSAEIAGLSDDETPVLIYSTADGQAAGQAIPMAVPEGERRYQCTLPPGKTGLQQDYDYYITAGDCRTRRYAIDVRSAPAIVVDRAVYDYPGYTGLADQTDNSGGDLRAIEGTEITIHAVANAKIKPGSAEIDLGCTGRRGLEMSVDGLKATGRFRLKLNPDDENSPLYDSYQLRFADDEGRLNPHPVRHRIEVVRDLPPDVQVIEPKEPEVRVAENGQVAISVEAKDPDFALRRVEIRAVRGDNRSLSIAPLLDKRRPAEPVAGEFQGSFVFEPAKFGLTAGDRVQYWAMAEDNKEPAVNRTETEKRWIVVESPQPQDRRQQGEKADRPDQANDPKKPGEKSAPRQNAGQQPQDGQGEDQPSQDPAEGKQSQDGKQSPDGKGGNEQDGQKSDENQPGEKQSGDGDNGEQQQGDPSQSGEEENQRVDPEAEAGDAFQEILDDKKQQQEKQPQEESQPDGQNQSENKQDRQENQTEQQRQDGSQQSNNEQNQSGEPQSDEEGSQNGNQRQDGEQSSAKDKGKQQSGPGLPGENKNQPAEPKPGEQEPSGDNSSSTESGQKKDGTQKSTAQKTPGEKTESKPDGKGDKSDGQKQGGDESASAKNANKEPNDKPGEKSPDDRGKDGETGKQQQPDNEDRGKEDKPGGDKGPGKKDLPRENPNKTADPGGNFPNEEKGDPNEKLRPDKPGNAPGDREEPETPTPAKNDDESRAKGETSGDRKGKGEKGAGQQSNQEGLGGPGSNTPADQGASQANEPGQGETGSEAGDQKASQTPTGSDKKTAAKGGSTNGQEQGETTPDGRSPAGKQSDSNEPSNQQQPPQSPDNSGIPTEQGGDSRDGVKGRAAGGGKPGTSSSSTPDKPTDTGPDNTNIDYARRQTELALEHLRDQLAKEKPELLDKLGWTKDDARRFLDRWEQMRRAAEQKGPEGEQAKRQFDEALKSLGLGRGTELKHGGVATDSPETQRDAGRSTPPPDWADHLRAYTRGVAGEEPKK